MLSPTCSLAKSAQLLSFKRSKCKMCKLLVVKRRGERSQLTLASMIGPTPLLHFCPKIPHTNVHCLTLFPINAQLTLSRGKVNMLTASYLLLSCS